MVNLIHGESHLQPKSSGVRLFFYSDDGGRIMSDKLEKARLKVTEADEQIVPLLVKRLAAVEEIGLIKQEEGIDVKDSGQEKKVLEKVAELAGHENAEYVQQIYKEIMAQACRFQQKQKEEIK